MTIIAENDKVISLSEKREAKNNEKRKTIKLPEIEKTDSLAALLIETMKENAKAKRRQAKERAKDNAKVKRSYRLPTDGNDGA